MVDSCNINGIRCTACCAAIALCTSRKGLLKQGDGGDSQFIRENWKQISRRRAFKKNPHLKTRGWEQSHSFWHCKRVTNAGCSVHERRPHVCMGYPFYTHDKDYIDAQLKLVPEYHPECSEWKIPLKEVA